MSISIIVPVLNESPTLQNFLRQLQPLRRCGCELIVVDGASKDDSAALATPWADRVLTSERGRAHQMNAGARIARGDVVWFLHSDSVLPAGADRAIQQAFADDQAVWGRFDVRLSGDAWLLRVVETLMNQRSRYSGIATGDQGIFVRRAAFERIGGYPAIALMEDIALSRALKRYSRPVCLRQKLITSSRRWETRGIVKTVFQMWWLRLLYCCGAAPERLARRYYGG